MSPAAFRLRYLVGLLCHVAVALVASSDLSTSPSAAADAVGPCYLASTFVENSDLKHWPGFPVELYIDQGTLPVEHRAAYLEGIQRGVDLWSVATGGEIGRFHVNFDRPDSPISLSMTDGPLPDQAVGSTELTFQGQELVEARVRIRPSEFEETPLLVDDVASTTAHEMGHALGIVRHSPHQGDKMWQSGNFSPRNRNRSPLSLLTPRDINTLRRAYCQ